MSKKRSSFQWSPRRFTMALEPRHLFDGAAPAALAAAAQAAEKPQPTVGDNTANEVIVVDSRVTNGVELAKSLDSTARVLVLDQRSDGIAQIAAALEGEHNLGAIHILSHGSGDGLILGQGLLDQNDLLQQSALLANIGATLGADGDILLYGCDVAADSRAFIDTFAALTQADVAASPNETGSARLGGDWLLEASTGTIETKALMFEAFDELLAPPSIVDGGGGRTTLEDTPLSISGLSITDPDGSSQTVTVTATHGTVTLHAGSGVTITGGADSSATVTFTGTLAQVNAAINGINFTPTGDYAGSASISLTTNDGSTTAGPTTINLTVTAVDDAPVAVADSISATEDGAAASGNVLTNDINVDAPTDTLTVIGLRTGTVAAGSGTAGSIGNPLVGIYGSLTINANGGYTYVVDNGLASVQALRAGQTVNESFTYSLSDGHSSVAGDITVTITGTNDAPTVIGTPAKIVTVPIPENASNAENPGTTIGDLLSDVDHRTVVNDVDTGSTLGIAIYGGSTTNGMTGTWQYSLDGTHWLTAAPFSTGAALLLPANAKLRFVAADNADDTKESGVATIQYYVWDGSNGVAGDTGDVTSRGNATPYSAANLTADFAVTSRNDIPTVTPVALSLNEGSTATIGATQLPVVDADNDPDQLIYQVKALPTKGVLLFNGKAVVVGALFTQDDVISGRLTYRHTSGELSANASDSATFTLRDGAGGVVDDILLPISIVDVNAQIAIVGGTQTVAERTGSEASDYSVLDLNLSDADGDPNRMTLTFTSLPDPAVGRLQYWNGSAYVDVVLSMSLTRAQLLANPLHFISTGAEPTVVPGSDFAGPAKPTASFNVQASDGHQVLTPTTATQTVTLTIAPRNDAPVPVTHLLSAQQGGAAVTISESFLSASDVDSPASDRLYTISTVPAHGTLRLNGVIVGAGATFTQADLAAGRLTYTHDGSATDGNPLTADDSFTFSVNDKDGGIASGTLPINIVPDVPVPPEPGGTLGAIVAEGSFRSLTGALTDSSIYTLSSAPAHGSIYVNGIVLAMGGSFTQAQIDAGQVVYVSDGSEPDAFASPYHDFFTVSRSGGSVSGSSTVDLTVTPVDDAPTITQTQGTVGTNQDGTTLLEQSLVDGSNSFTLAGVGNAVKLTLANLQYHDPDSAIGALAYVLESAPSGGQLRRWDASGSAWVALAAGERFAAQDVADGKIAYFHDPASELRNDSISVYLVDGSVVQVGDLLISPPSISEKGTVTVDDGDSQLSIAKGNIGRSPSRTVNFVIANVNDPPAAVDSAFSVEEGYSSQGSGHADDNAGRIKVLNATILSSTDSDNALSGFVYTITALPAHGRIEIDRGSGFVALLPGDLGTASAQFTYDMLVGGKLRYVQDGSESTADSFKWRVNDKATDAPVNQDSNEATVTIDIIPHNDPPLVFNNTGASVPEGGVRHIGPTMLGSEQTGDTDIDNSSRQTQFRITSAVQYGTLYLDKGGVITVLGSGSAFTLADVQDGYLKYRHNGSETPSTDFFDFVISDGSGSSEPPGRFDITILPVNDAPKLSGLNPLTYFEDDGQTIIDASVLFSDADLANDVNGHYNSGSTLTIAYTSGFAAGDQLALSGLGAISVVGSDVRYNGVSIGTIDASKNGVNGSDLKITFNGNADVAAVKAVLENLTFQNTDTANASQATAQATRTLSYTFVDGGGTASYTDDEGTAINGVDTVTATNTIVVKQRNDAPLLADGDTTLVSITEDDTADGRSLLVSTLLGANVSDVDNGALQGIAITGLTAGNGTWQYSLDSTNGSDGTWSTIGSVSATNALLLSSTAYVRFIPDGKNGTEANFTYRAWDQTSGSAGGRANSSPQGGTTAFSTESNVVSLSVSSVNDAPVLDPVTVLNVTQNEDAGPPVGAVGTLISSLVGGVSDVDTGSVQGVAITNVNASNGVWWYSIDNGATWLALGTPSADAARLLAADANTRIYFEPTTANYNGTQSAPLTLRAWDRSDLAANGSLADTTNNGGTTAFSAATDSVSLTVNAVNDAPTLSVTTHVFTYGTENNTVAITGISIDDPDLARGETPTSTPPMQVRLNVGTSGKLNLTLNGCTVSAGALNSNDLTLQGTLAQINAALATLSYDSGDDPTTSDTLHIAVSDRGNVGSGGALTANDTIALNGIVPVNDAPTSSGPASVAATEDTVFHFTGANTLSIADADARNGPLKVTLSIGQGTLLLGTTTGITFSAGANGSGSMEIVGTLAELNAALASLSYTPVADANALNVSASARTLHFDVNDQGYGEDGAPGTPLSAATRDIVIDIAAVNDTPTLDVDAAPGVQVSGALFAAESRDGATTTVVTGITLSDNRDILDSGYGSVQLVVSAVHGTLSLDPASGVTVIVAGRSITLSGTITDINAAIAANKLTYLPDTHFSGADTLSFVFHDQGNSGSGGDKTASGSLAVTVAGLNDAPGFTGLGGGLPDVTFTEDGAAVVLDANAILNDPELDAFDNWGGAVLTLQRSAAIGNAGTAAVDDIFGVTGSGASGVNFNGANIRIGTTVVGTFTNTGGILTITFADATTSAQATQVLRAITYRNGNDNPPSQVTIGYTIDDGNTNTGPTAQGAANPTLALIGSGSVIVGIDANNDAPVLSGVPATAAYTEDGSPSVLAPAAALSDPELSFFGGGSGDWGGAVLSLTRVGGANVNDVFGVTGSGDTGVNFSGGTIRIGTTVVGTFTNGGGTLHITFASGTSTADVEQVASAITYGNTVQSLGAGQQDSVPLRWTIDDGNVLAQGAGGAKQVSFDQTVTVNGVNDAPQLGDTALTLSANEDAVAPSGAVGTLISALSGGISDPDSGSLQGVAITGADGSHGTWYYSTDNGVHWTAVGAVADDSALLLRAGDRLYFQPANDVNGSFAAGLTLRAWDQTSGSAGNKVDTRANGGTTAFSTATDTVTLTVNPANDAPTRLLAGVVLGASLEDAASPNQATVASLFGAAFSDARDEQSGFGGTAANNLAGIVVTANAATAGQGVWQYSADGSTGWTTIGTGLTSASGLFLPAGYTLRFVPNANWNGTPGNLTARLVDDSTGSLPAAGASVDVSNDTTLSGGTTRYSNSANAVTLSTSVGAVNDAPTLSAASINLDEDIGSAANTGSTVSALFGSLYGDGTDNVSGGSSAQAFAGLAVSGNSADPATQGRWQYNTGAGWVDVPTNLSTGNALILPTSASLRFAPVADYNGTPPVLAVHAIDASAGSVAAAQSGQDLGTVGGGSRYSTATTLTAVVAAVNDAPTIAGFAGTPVFVENAATPVRLDLDGNVVVADVELGGNWNGATLTVQRSGTANSADIFGFVDDSPGNPALGVQTSGSAIVVDGVAVGGFTQVGGKLTITFNASADAASVGRVVGALSYRNTSDVPPAFAQINVVLSDQNTGGAQGSGGVLTAQSSVTVNIVQINDAPTIAGLDATPTYTENGAAIQIDGNVTLADAELDGGGQWTGATLTVARQGGASADDVFGATAALGFTGSTAGNVVVGGVVVGTYTQSAGTLTITFNAAATASRVDAVIQGLTYRNTSDAPPATVTLDYTVSDQNTGLAGTIPQGQLSAGDSTVSPLTATMSATINISRGNDAPVISTAPPAVGYTEQGTPVLVDANLTLSDADDGYLASATVSIGSPVAGDTLAVITTGTNISASYVGGVLTLTGIDTVAHYQEVLRSLVFSSGSDDPTADTTRPSRTLTVSVTDANADGSGARTTNSTRTVNLTPVNDAPLIAGAGSTHSYTENVAPLLLEPALLLSDADDTQFDQAVIRIGAGFVAGDHLLFVDQNGISGTYDGNTGVLKLSGVASAAAYQAALRSIRFDSTSDSPGDASRTISWTVRDVNSDAAANGRQNALSVTTTVNVIAVNDTPVARADTNSIAKASALPATGDVLLNDSDVDGGTLVVSGVNNGAVSGVLGSPLVGGNGFGELLLAADGSYSFRVYTDNATVAALGAGATVSETFNYTISDGQGGFSTATLTIVIHGANDAPRATADHNTISEGTASIGVGAPGVLTNDSDLNGDSLAVIGVAAGADRPPATATPVSGGSATTIDGLYGRLDLAADGSYVYTLNNADPAVNALSVGQQLSDSFTYVIADGKGGTASTNLVIAIDGVNDTPVAVDDAVSVPANGPAVAGQVLSNDSDPDTNDTLTVSKVNGQAAHVGQPVVGTHGSLTLNADGTYSYLPNTTSAKALAVGEKATDTFTYTISDGHGGTATATLTVTLSGENDSPLAQADDNSMTEDQTVSSGNLISGSRVNGGGVSSLSPVSVDSDPDNGDTLVVSAITNTDGTAGAVGSPLAGRYGHVTVAADGSYVYTLDHRRRPRRQGEQHSGDYHQRPQRSANGERRCLRHRRYRRTARRHTDQGQRPRQRQRSR